VVNEISALDQEFTLGYLLLIEKKALGLPVLF
jgi:hypothetical protein